MDATDQVILVADDEANILMLLEMELQAEGFKTIGCNDGAKALAQIEINSQHWPYWIGICRSSPGSMFAVGCGIPATAYR